MESFRHRRSVQTRALLVAGLLILGSGRLMAQDTTSIPKTHTVVKGDNLWNLAGKYLNDPFRWPEIFHRNTDVVNCVRHGTRSFAAPNKCRAAAWGGP